MRDFGGKRSTVWGRDQLMAAGPAPGKRTQTESLPLASRPVQRKAAMSAPVPVIPNGPRPTIVELFGSAVQHRAAGTDPDTTAVHESAQRGIATASSPLPHAGTIQRAFGRHDVSTIRAHVGPDAMASARAMGACAYATGEHIVLGDGADLHTVAHEAAHVVQQRGGVQLNAGVGEVGDRYERHADAVANLVVQGQSAEAALDNLAAPGGGARAAVQRYVPRYEERVIDETAYAGRASEQARGHNGFNESNHGWVEVTTQQGDVQQVKQASVRGEAHTEELLLDQVFRAYPGTSNKPDPADPTLTRITQLYTEREPCTDGTDGTADAKRKSRVDTWSTCDAYLKQVLHKDVPVRFSVRNDPGSHKEFMNDQLRRYFTEIATGECRMTLAEARSARNLENYHSWTRDISFRIYGHHGRDYAGDLRLHDELLEEYHNTFSPLGFGGETLASRLREAFESGEHCAGSTPVQDAMRKAYDEETRAALITVDLDSVDPASHEEERGGSAAAPRKPERFERMRGGEDDRGTKRKDRQQEAATLVTLHGPDEGDQDREREEDNEEEEEGEERGGSAAASRKRGRFKRLRGGEDYRGTKHKDCDNDEPEDDRGHAGGAPTGAQAPLADLAGGSAG
jgi:hypothetical protein